MSKKLKVESIEEYLARGNTIKILPTVEYKRQPDVIRKTVVGPAIFLTLEEADLYYGEAKENLKPKKQKQSPRIDINALPEALRAKILKRIKEESLGEEEDFYEEEDQD
jgi:hypothetical protein